MKVQYNLKYTDEKTGARLGEIVFNGKTYLVPVEECGSDKRLRIEPAKNGQVRGIT